MASTMILRIFSHSNIILILFLPSTMIFRTFPHSNLIMNYFLTSSMILRICLPSTMIFRIFLPSALILTPPTLRSRFRFNLRYMKTKKTIVILDLVKGKNLRQRPNSVLYSYKDRIHSITAAFDLLSDKSNIVMNQIFCKEQCG